MKMSKIIFSGIGVVLMLMVLVYSGKILENIDAEEVLVVQSPISGDLTWYVTPGIKWQGGGKTTTYHKRAIYEFSCKKDEKGECFPSDDRRIKIRFNDGGHAYMSGSIQYELPLDEKNLTSLHTRFGSQEAIQKQLVETVVNKSVYMTGPLMSSKESYAEKRNNLISLVEDQVASGVYKTTQRDEKTKDALTGAEKTITIVQIVVNQDGLLERQEDGQLTIFGIKPFNFSVVEVQYDATVEKQIQQQQQLTMQVQTAMAEARQAEQRVITATKEGEANAAKSKWEQEVIKAKMVTEAEQNKEVAKLGAEQKKEVAILEKEAAESTKQKEILLGQGEYERKRLVMSADGALEKKLETYENVMAKFAEEFSKQKWVPEFQIGMAGGSVQGNAATTLIDLLTVKTARDLGLDLNVRQQNQQK